MKTFQGYRRADGRTGIRNLILVMPGVHCSELAAKKIVQAVPGTTFLPNPSGCGQSHYDMQTALKVLSGLCANGNVYGVLIVGLGCEFLAEKDYREAILGKADLPVHYIGIQEEGGIARTTEAGAVIARKLVAGALACRREEIPLSELILGLECGGSDPTSGLSANVVLGKVTDLVIEAGGSAVMSETAEAVGAEHILKMRGKTPEIGQKLYDAVTGWEKARQAETGENIRANNPSPGNLSSGLTTLAEKSLGCLHKSGSHPFEDCLEYGDRISGKGLFFLNAPSYDILNTTALASAGAQLIAFTTGMGNPIGNPIAPVVKITGNQTTAQRMSDFIDFDTSATLSGLLSPDQAAADLLKLLIEVADGRASLAEMNGACEISINQSFSCP